MESEQIRKLRNKLIKLFESNGYKVLIEDVKNSFTTSSTIWTIVDMSEPLDYSNGKLAMRFELTSYGLSTSETVVLNFTSTDVQLKSNNVIYELLDLMYEETHNLKFYSSSIDFGNNPNFFGSIFNDLKQFEEKPGIKVIGFGKYGISLRDYRRLPGSGKFVLKAPKIGLDELRAIDGFLKSPPAINKINSRKIIEELIDILKINLPDFDIRLNILNDSMALPFELTTEILVEHRRETYKLLTKFVDNDKMLINIGDLLNKITGGILDKIDDVDPSDYDDEIESIIEEMKEEAGSILDKRRIAKRDKELQEIILQAYKDIADKYSLRVISNATQLDLGIFKQTEIYTGDKYNFLGGYSEGLREYLPKNARYISDVIVLEKPSEYERLIKYLKNRTINVDRVDLLKNQPSVGVDLVVWRAETKNYRDELRGVFFGDKGAAEQYLVKEAAALVEELKKAGKKDFFLEGKLVLGGVYQEGGSTLKSERVLIRRPFIAPNKDTLIIWLAANGDEEAKKLLESNEWGEISIRRVRSYDSQTGIVGSKSLPPYPLKDKVISRAMRRLGYDAVIYVDYHEIQITDFQKVLLTPQLEAFKPPSRLTPEVIGNRQSPRLRWMAQHDNTPVNIEKIYQFLDTIQNPVALKEIGVFEDTDLVYGLYKDEFVKKQIEKYGGHSVANYYDEYIKMRRGSKTGLEWLELSIKKLEESILRKNTIHFFLDGMGGLDSIKEILMMASEYQDKITSIELRYILKNWERFKGIVKFYIDGQEVFFEGWSAQTKLKVKHTIKPEYLPLKDLYDEIDIHDRLRIIETKEKLAEKLTAGFDKMIVIDAEEFKKVLEAQGNPISSIDESNIKYLAEVERLDGIDSYPKIYVDRHGKIDILEGNHRTELASRQKKKIEIAVKSSDLDGILKRISEILGDKRVRLIYTDAMTTAYRLNKDIQRPIRPAPIENPTPLAHSIEIADEGWMKKFKTPEIIDEFKKLMSKYLSTQELALSADDLGGLTKLKEIAEPLIAEIRDVYGTYQSYKLDMVSLINNKTPFSIEVLQDIAYRFLKREYVNFINLIFRHQEIKPTLALLRAMKDGYKFDGPIKGILHILQDSTRQHFTETIKSQFLYFVKEKLGWQIPNDFLENLFRETIDISQNLIKFPTIEEFTELFNTGKIIREKSIPAIIQEVIEEIKPHKINIAENIEVAAPNPIQQTPKETQRFVKEVFLDGKPQKGATALSASFDYLNTFKQIAKGLIAISPAIASFVIKDPVQFNQNITLAKLTDSEIKFYFDVLSIYETSKVVQSKNKKPIITDAIVQKLYSDFKKSLLETQDLRTLFDEFGRPAINTVPRDILILTQELRKHYRVLIDGASIELLEQQHKSATNRASKTFSRQDKEAVVMTNEFYVEKTTGKELWEILAAEKKLAWLETKIQETGTTFLDKLIKGKSVFDAPNIPKDIRKPIPNIKDLLFKNKKTNISDDAEQRISLAQEYITESIDKFFANSLENIKDYPITVPWELKEFSDEQLKQFYQELLVAIGSAIITGVTSGGAWLFIDVALSAYFLLSLRSEFKEIPKSAIISAKPKIGDKNKYIDFIARINNGEIPSEAFKSSGLVDEIPKHQLPDVPGFESKYEKLSLLINEYTKNYSNIEDTFFNKDKKEALYLELIENIRKLGIFSESEIKSLIEDTRPIDPVSYNEDFVVPNIIKQGIQNIQKQKLELINTLRGRLQDIIDNKEQLLASRSNGNIKLYKEELQTFNDAISTALSEVDSLTELLKIFDTLSKEQQLLVLKKLSVLSFKGFDFNAKFKKYLDFLPQSQKDALGIFLDNDDPDIFVPSPSAPSKIVVPTQPTDAAKVEDTAKQIFKSPFIEHEWMQSLDDAIESYKQREVKGISKTKYSIDDAMYIVPMGGPLADTFQRNIYVKNNTQKPIVSEIGKEADGLVNNNPAPINDIPQDKSINKNAPPSWFNEDYMKRWSNGASLEETWLWYKDFFGSLSDDKLIREGHKDFVNWRKQSSQLEPKDPIQSPQTNKLPIKENKKQKELIDWIDSEEANEFWWVVPAQKPDGIAGSLPDINQKKFQIKNDIISGKIKSEEDIKDELLEIAIKELSKDSGVDYLEDKNYENSDFYFESPDGTKESIKGNKVSEFIEKTYKESQNDFVSRKHYNTAKKAHKTLKETQKKLDKKKKKEEKESKKVKEKEAKKEAKKKVYIDRETGEVSYEGDDGKAPKFPDTAKISTYTKGNYERKLAIEKKRKENQYKQSYQTNKSRWEKYVQDEKKKGNLVKDDNKSRVEHGAQKTNGHSAGCQCSGCKALLKEEEMWRNAAEAMQRYDDALKKAALLAAEKLKKEAEEAAEKAKQRKEEEEKRQKELEEQRREAAKKQQKQPIVYNGMFVAGKRPIELPISDGGYGLGLPFGKRPIEIGPEQIINYRPAPKISDGGGLGPIPAMPPLVDKEEMPPKAIDAPKQYSFGMEEIVPPQLTDLPISDGGHGLGKPKKLSDESTISEEEIIVYNKPLPIHDGGGGFGIPKINTELVNNQELGSKKGSIINGNDPFASPQNPVPLGGEPPAEKPMPTPKPPPPIPPTPPSKGQLGVSTSNPFKEKDDYSGVAKSAGISRQSTIMPTKKEVVINKTIKTIKPGGKY